MKSVPETILCIVAPPENRGDRRKPGFLSPAPGFFEACRHHPPMGGVLAIYRPGH